MLTKTVHGQVNECDSDCTVEHSRQGLKRIGCKASRAVRKGSLPSAPVAPAGMAFWTDTAEKLPDLYVWAHDKSGVQINFM